MYILYFILVGALSVYSYVLVDPNFTLFNHPFWEMFRNSVVLLGYYNRLNSWYIYFSIVVLLFIAQYFFMRSWKKHNPLRISIIVALILLVAYPLLSHDFFNYLFDAKIVTYYQGNPYILRALDFPTDPWVRFMHWTHRTYPYGPSFLIVSLIPSFLAGGKLVLNYIFFKLMFASCYVGSVWALSKINKKYALFFATSPLVLIEGLVNTHNDMVALFFAFIGISLLWNSKKYSARILFTLSFLTKYISLPILFVTRKKSIWTFASFIVLHLLLIYLGIQQEIQAWYFLNLLIFIPWYFKYIQSLTILYIGLLLSYYPYIRLDSWNGPSVYIKHVIVLVALGTTILYLFYDNRKYLSASFFKR
ncbi:MAG: hypothetical protein NUV65_04240 [Candidatus Roizmanbacteria bacterium]|nr:hypothetical protein [Candidatus Roizmanbacteria bacterium]